MIRNKIFLKTIAVFLILETLANTIVPTISWALTSGPTAPEATSFEPVDTTDMVNSVTGDFVYNMSLIEIPGPAGSYPLTLSYHGEIRPDLDASWMGLGWSLNPGSINRMTNGLPDDFNGVNTVRRDFWEGGLMTQESYGISVGIGNIATVGAGVIIANDTYKGRGVGGYTGVSLGFNVGPIGASVSAQLTLSPYGGDVTASLGVGLGIGQSLGAISSSAGVGLSVNSHGKLSAGVSGGISVYGNNLLDASMSSDGGRPSVGVSGYRASGNNSNNGKVSTNENGWSFDIPVYYGINVHLSKQYTRYWMDQTENLENYGALNFDADDIGEASSKVFDSYHVEGYESLGVGENPARYANGTYADYDQYNVNAQGLGGSFRPHHYILNVNSQDIEVTENNEKVKSILGYYIPPHSEGLRYSFINDFSSRVLHNPLDIAYNQTIQGYYQEHLDEPGTDYVAWKTRMQETYTSNENIPLFFPYTSPKVGIEGYDVPGNKRKLPNVPGSKHIEYFTNETIINNINEAYAGGFIDCNASGFVRSVPEDNPGGGVGGFVVTNSSGVTYNFSLPVYSYDEYVYSQNKDVQDKISFNNVEQRSKYAYTWFLTSVTGPDYVDRGPDGNPDHKLNEYDWGYWVDFQYGKWTDKFLWRTPAEGFKEDLDSRFQSFSKGKKELYYLNAIKTATHIAYFVKEIRADGKGVTAKKSESVLTDKAHSVTYVDEGGFNFQADPLALLFPGTQANPGAMLLESDFQNVSIPASTLRLNKIILTENNGVDLSDLIQATNTYNHAYDYSIVDRQIVTAYNEFKSQSFNSPSTTWLQQNFPGPKIITETFNLHHGENILDIYDVESNPFPAEQILREIDFNFDYSLTPSTPNSFDEEGLLYACNLCEDFIPNNSLLQSKLGKLTLNSVIFKGKSGIESLPAIKFNYDNTNSDLINGQITAVDDIKKTIAISVTQNSEQFQVGDVIKLNQGQNTFYGYITESSSLARAKIISSQLPILGYAQFRPTKNPPYNKDFFDMWGLYKVDFYPDLNGNLERYPTPISVSNTDVWSLREIQTSLGSKIKINYESDSYNESVLSKNLSIPLNVESNELVNGNGPNDYYIKVTLKAQLPQESALDFIALGYTSNFLIELAAATNICYTDRPCQPYIVQSGEVIEVQNKTIKVAIYIPGSDYNGILDAVIPLNPRDLQYGGGLRVQSIGVDNPIKSETRYTKYDYEFDGVSSGVTSYEPLTIGKINLNSSHSELNRIYAKLRLEPYLNMLRLSREVPAPGVYYGKIKISEMIVDHAGHETEVPGYSIYEFETFNKDMIEWDDNIGTEVSSSGTFRDQAYSKILRNKKTLKNYTQQLGSLKSITLYDQHGNKISETINHYLHDDESQEYKAALARYNYQGVIEETFNNARWVKSKFNTPGVPPSHTLMGLVSKKETYPSVQTGTTVINYKSGVKTKTETLGFDFYSGTPTKTLSTDGYGNKYLSELHSAYKQYGAMGLRIDGGNNMLVQEAARYNYKVDNTDVNIKTGLLSASAQTWSKAIPTLAVSEDGLLNDPAQYNVWKKQSSLTWKGDDQPLDADGLYPASYFEAYNFNGENGEQWQKNSEITQYDIFSHALEASDINGNYVSTKMSHDQTKVFATAANSQYDEFAFSGAEEEVGTNGVFGGNVKRGNATEVTKQGIFDNTTTHTGSKALQVTSELGKAFEYTFTANAARGYHGSVWVNSNAGRLFYSINDVMQEAGIPTDSRKAGLWYLVLIDIPKSTETRTIKIWSASTGATCNFDDFRVCPIDAAMTSFVYNEWGELSHILDNNNLYTEYRYDGLGRLTETYKETFQRDFGVQGLAKVSEINYNYGLDNPFLITVNSTSTGNAGTIAPYGQSYVVRDNSIIYELVTNCTSDLLSQVSIDNQPINLRQSSLILADGTSVSINGRFITFNNVKGNHSIHAAYTDPVAAPGVIRCYNSYEYYGTGEDCFDGSYEYSYYDECGQLTELFRVFDWQSIPDNIRDMHQQSSYACCELNGNNGCGCQN